MQEERAGACAGPTAAERCMRRKEEAQSFWDQLSRSRAREYMQDAEFLRQLRYDYGRVLKLQKLFGKVWEEYGTNVYRLIAEAHGETWDAEDEEKTAFAIAQQKKK